MTNVALPPVSINGSSFQYHNIDVICPTFNRFPKVQSQILSLGTEIVDLLVDMRKAQYQGIPNQGLAGEGFANRMLAAQALEDKFQASMLACADAYSTLQIITEERDTLALARDQLYDVYSIAHRSKIGKSLIQAADAAMETLVEAAAGVETPAASMGELGLQVGQHVVGEIAQRVYGQGVQTGSLLNQIKTLRQQ